MTTKVFPAGANGTITAPPSKSMTQRAIAAALLANGETVLINPSFCKDSLAALGMIRALGAEIEKKDVSLNIRGGLRAVSTRLNCGESGLAMRMFSPIAALLPQEIEFTGEGSLPKRPVSMIEEALLQLGAGFRSQGGFLPFVIQGPIHGGKAVIDGSLSSQLLTGLLMALPLAASDSEIYVRNLKSKPYVSMTLQLLSDFGIDIENQNFEVFKISGNQKYNPRTYLIEGDWSGAAFLLVAGAVSGNVVVKGLSAYSLQSDVAILEALLLAGAQPVISENLIEIAKAELKAFKFDATECPDLFPPLAALAASCVGTTEIAGVERLIHKESNRALAITGELKKSGIEAGTTGNVMWITGGKANGGSSDSHNDHRIAMMSSVLAMNAKNPVEIAQAECVEKSYPGFYDDIRKLGVAVEFNEDGL